MDGLLKINSQRSGRDKIFRTAHYALKMINSFSPNKTSLDLVGLEKEVANFRKMLRLGTCADTIYGAKTTASYTDPFTRLTTTLSRVAMALYLYNDHLAWLSSKGILGGMDREQVLFESIADERVGFAKNSIHFPAEHKCRQVVAHRDPVQPSPRLVRDQVDHEEREVQESVDGREGASGGLSRHPHQLLRRMDPSRGHRTRPSSKMVRGTDGGRLQSGGNSHAAEPGAKNVSGRINRVRAYSSKSYFIFSEPCNYARKNTD